MITETLKAGGVRGRLARYILAGGGAAVIDLGGFLLLLRAGLAVAPAAALSFAIAAVVNFTLSALFVFRERPTWARFVAFMAAAVLGLAINTSVTVLAEGAGLWNALAKVTGIGVAFLFNFTVNHALVFRARRDAP